MDTTTSQAAQKTSDGKATPRQQPARRMQATYEAANNEIAAMRYHGMTTSMSPASRNRVEVPGPGHYNVGKGDEVLCKVNNRRTVFSKQERFRPVPPYLPGETRPREKQPGPADYEIEQKTCLGKYRSGKVQRAPSWSIPKRKPLEIAKTSC
eukprot:TRINITY_DN8794_c0_g1_i2.p1 TRINITY_DN8794_c0_g1~~TRINITY_DN8794_c0_g1_i2.p1  ORF type:complete len:152 (+),score=36.67 TRINITY_DN8794_c0_g1_i2:93-548(+)